MPKPALPSPAPDPLDHLLGGGVLVGFIAVMMVVTLATYILGVLTSWPAALHARPPAAVGTSPWADCQ